MAELIVSFQSIFSFSLSPAAAVVGRFRSFVVDDEMEFYCLINKKRKVAAWCWNRNNDEWERNLVFYIYYSNHPTYRFFN